MTQKRISIIVSDKGDVWYNQFMSNASMYISNLNCCTCFYFKIIWYKSQYHTRFSICKILEMRSGLPCWIWFGHAVPPLRYDLWEIVFAYGISGLWKCIILHRLYKRSFLPELWIKLVPRKIYSYSWPWCIHKRCQCISKIL